VSENEAPKSTVYTRTLQLAAVTLGGRSALAGRLRVDEAALEPWISGAEFPPHEVFLAALDIVAGGPLIDAGTAQRRAAGAAQRRADRLQASANRVRESAERIQASANRAQQQADLTRQRADATRPDGADDARFRQVKPKDSAPASNKPEEKKTRDG
jgi:hypothetical protein